MSIRSDVVSDLVRTLQMFGKEKQFKGELCFCRTDGPYCVGQRECIEAQSVIKAVAFVDKTLPASEKIRSGVWQHYRTLEKYLVFGVGRHTENDEELVCYVPLYQHPAGGLPLQFRPVKMWLERVWHEKVEYPRFIYLGDRLDPKETPK